MLLKYINLIYSKLQIMGRAQWIVIIFYGVCKAPNWICFGLLWRVMLLRIWCLELYILL